MEAAAKDDRQHLGRLYVGVDLFPRRPAALCIPPEVEPRWRVFRSRDYVDHAGLAILVKAAHLKVRHVLELLQVMVKSVFHVVVRYLVLVELSFQLFEEG